MNNDIKILNIKWRTWYFLTKIEDHFGLRASVIFRPQYVWFPSHLYIGVIHNSSGQLAELIIYAISQSYICRVTRSYRPISRYYSHLVAVRGRCMISHVHAGTLGFTYMET